MSVGRLFVAIVWCAGLVTGLLLPRVPGLDALPMPYFTVPLAVGLVLDVAVQTGLVRAARPVTMNERMAGVLGGSIIAYLVAAAFHP